MSPEPPEAQALGLHVYRGFYLHVTLPSEPSYFKTNKSKPLLKPWIEFLFQYMYTCVCVKSNQAITFNSWFWFFYMYSMLGDFVWFWFQDYSDLKAALYCICIKCNSTSAFYCTCTGWNTRWRHITTSWWPPSRHIHVPAKTNKKSHPKYYTQDTDQCNMETVKISMYM